ncbi:LexA family transcriptional regulator [Acetobacter malorum]|nr:LexA family transcriptional regulator [Acetobacter malorum]
MSANMRNIANLASAKMRRDLIASMCENAHMPKDVRTLRSEQQSYIDGIKNRTGKSYSAIARAIGAAPSTIVRFMDDTASSHSLSAKTMEKLKIVFDLPSVSVPNIEHLVYSEPVALAGSIQAGVWQDTGLFTPQAPPEYIMIAPDERYPGIRRWAFRVRGDSMDKIYPDGTIIVAVSFFDLCRQPKTGDKVIAIRKEHGLEEATLKEIEILADGSVALWPRSTNPKFSQAIIINNSIDDNIPDDGCHSEYRVEGLVIQSIRRE